MSAHHSTTTPTLIFTKNNGQRLFLVSLLTLSQVPHLAHAGLLGWLGINDNLASSPHEFLTAEQAFVLSTNQTANTLTLSFDIAPGYYLYRHQLTIEPEQATFGDWKLPQGEPHEDTYFGESQVYKQSFSLHLPLQQVSEQAEMIVQYQGCTTDLCYAPQTVRIPLQAKSK